FTHQTLDRSRSQIRLISVLPEAEGPVRCTIRLVDLDANPTPDYRALSYTWGPPSPKHHIYVNGKPLAVRLNLYDFLLAFRKRLYQFQGDGFYEEETQWLWIDQICIDQSVVEERNHQVRMMAAIYKTATYVYVWLGSSDKHTEAAMQILKSEELAGLLEPGAIETLRTFFQNLYWTRLWILQEIMLARYIRIICGDSLLSWEELRHFCVSALDSGALEGLRLPILTKWLAENALSAKTYSLEELFDTFEESQCQDPRDRIFGLQGLLEKKDQIRIDYAKSIDEVYYD
ncbi:HET-domain-containing protein, partial [Lizonia empirigonia]